MLVFDWSETVWILSIIGDRWLRALAAERRGDSICVFARTLDCRAIDTWIVRAVPEELSKLHPDLPILPTDRLGADLLIVARDLDNLAIDMASRAGDGSRKQYPPSGLARSRRFTI